MTAARQSWIQVRSREAGLWLLGRELRMRAARAGGDLPRLIDIVMNTSFLGASIKAVQRADELEAFLALVRTQHPKYVLEIGTARGGTLFLLCRVSSPHAVVLSIDLPGGPFGGGYPPYREGLYKSFARQDQDVVLIREDSHGPQARSAVAAALGSNQLDVLFIDGERRYQGVKSDYSDYEPLVRPGGLIAFHDICRGQPDLDDGVAEFWDEVSRSQDSQTFITRGPEYPYGIGVIRKGSSLDK